MAEEVWYEKAMSDWQCSLNDAIERKRRKVFPQFFDIARNLISALMETLEGGDSGSFDGEPDRHKITAALHLSNIVGSEVLSPPVSRKIGDPIPEPNHKPVLDIDLPVWVRESTTPGHYHLIIDKEMPWDDYKRLLNVMCDVGILEPGFVKAAISRGASWIRTPWTEKLKEADNAEQSF